MNDVKRFQAIADIRFYLVMLMHNADRLKETTDGKAYANGSEIRRYAKRIEALLEELDK